MPAGIVDAKPRQESFRRIAGTRGLGAEQLEAVDVQHLDLILHWQRDHRLQHLAHDNGGGLRIE
jgi:hypothetical protein